MMRILVIAGLAVSLFVGPILAHTGVKNAAVMARMNSMSAIGEATKTMADMIRGKAEFDAQAAREAAKVMANHAAMVPGLFETPADDPKSEALETIWVNFDDFTAKAMDMEAAAMAAANVSSLNALKSAFGPINKSCRACHKLYRE